MFSKVKQVFFPSYLAALVSSLSKKFQNKIQVVCEWQPSAGEVGKAGYWFHANVEIQLKNWETQIERQKLSSYVFIIYRYTWYTNVIKKRNKNKFM